MKNKFRKLIPMVLTMILAIQCLSICALAEIVDHSESVVLSYDTNAETDISDNTETENNEVENEASEPVINDGLPYVEIFSNQSSVMTAGEPVVLTSVLHNAEGYEFLLQWQVDKGRGFEDIAGANDDSYTFEANADNLSYDWRLMLYYRPLSN